MADKIKVRLRNGGREIEIEAGRTDIDELLEKWWTSASVEDLNESGEQPATITRKSKPARKARSASSASEPSNAFDSNALANEIKQHKDLGLIEKKIIHVSGDSYNKIALILWIADEALTSGDIFRTLSGMDVKADLPTISKALKKNSSKFLTSTQRKSGGPPATYRLSAQAKSDFEKWLLANGS
jgi:hypothetical protein